jgi:hypothetical protein
MDLRSRSLTEDSWETAVAKIKTMLDTVEKAQGSPKKVMLTGKLFEYMMTVPTLLTEHTRLRLTSMEKSAQFRADPAGVKLIPVLNRYDRFIQRLNSSIPAQTPPSSILAQTPPSSIPAQTSPCPPLKRKRALRSLASSPSPSPSQSPSPRVKRSGRVSRNSIGKRRRSRSRSPSPIGKRRRGNDLEGSQSPVLRRSSRLNPKTEPPSAPSIGDSIFYEGEAKVGGDYEYNAEDMQWVGYNSNGSSHWIIPAHVTGVCLN